MAEDEDEAGDEQLAYAPGKRSAPKELRFARIPGSPGIAAYTKGHSDEAAREAQRRYVEFGQGIPRPMRVPSDLGLSLRIPEERARKFLDFLKDGLLVTRRLISDAAKRLENSYQLYDDYKQLFTRPRPPRMGKAWYPGKPTRLPAGKSQTEVELEFAVAEATEEAEAGVPRELLMERRTELRSTDLWEVREFLHKLGMATGRWEDGLPLTPVREREYTAVMRDPRFGSMGTLERHSLIAEKWMMEEKSEYRTAGDMVVTAMKRLPWIAKHLARLPESPSYSAAEIMAVQKALRETQAVAAGIYQKVHQQSKYFVPPQVVGLRGEKAIIRHQRGSPPTIPSEHIRSSRAMRRLPSFPVPKGFYGNPGEIVRRGGFPIHRVHQTRPIPRTEAQAIAEMRAKMRSMGYPDRLPTQQEITKWRLADETRRPLIQEQLAAERDATARFLPGFSPVDRYNIALILIKQLREKMVAAEREGQYQLAYMLAREGSRTAVEHNMSGEVVAVERNKMGEVVAGVVGGPIAEFNKRAAFYYAKAFPGAADGFTDLRRIQKEMAGKHILAPDEWAEIAARIEIAVAGAEIFDQGDSIRALAALVTKIAQDRVMLWKKHQEGKEPMTNPAGTRKQQAETAADMVVSAIRSTYQGPAFAEMRDHPMLRRMAYEKAVTMIHEGATPMLAAAKVTQDLVRSFMRGRHGSIGAAA